MPTKSSVKSKKGPKKHNGTSIEKRFESLKSHFFEHEIAFIHGKMKENEIAFQMERFIRGEIKVMLATTVIEVGVNVPNATLMIIETAEKMSLVAFLVVISLAQVGITIFRLPRMRRRRIRRTNRVFIICSDDHLRVHFTELCEIVDQYNKISFIIMLDSLEEFIPEIFTLKDCFLNRRRPTITKRPH